MSKADRVLNVKTPGAQPPSVDAQAGDDVEALVGDGSDVEVPAADPAVPATAPDLKAYIDAQISAGIAAGIKAIKRAQLHPGAKAHVELPDQSEVDPAKIKQMTLTKQGYVIPLDMGRAPAAIVAQLMANPLQR